MNNPNPTENIRRLYKSRKTRMIDGICGGLAEYFEIDVTLVRVLFVILGLFGGTGILLYIGGMVIIPINPEPLPGTDNKIGSNSNGARVWGIIIITLGVIILFSNIGWFPFYIFWNISWGIVLPIALILLGMALIYSYQQTKNGDESVMDDKTHESSYKRLYKSRADRKLFGVCGGLGSYFNIDPTIMRILFVLVTILSVGVGIVLYIAMAIFVPEER